MKKITHHNIITKSIDTSKKILSPVKAFVSEKTQKHFPKVHAYIKNNKKKAIIIGLVVLGILFLLFKPKGIDPNTITVVPVESSTLVSTVKANGKVTSIVDLELSFKKADIVEEVYVSVGDAVKKGQILATLKNQNELGMVNQARAVLARTLEGATNEEERVSQVLYDNAKKDYESTKRQQDILVENARRSLYSQGLSAEPTSVVNDRNVPNPTVSGTYTDTMEGTIVLTVYRSTGGYAFNTSGMTSITGQVSASNAVSIGKGLYVQFPAGFALEGNTTWNIDIPNKESTLYTTNLNTYQSAVSTRESMLQNADSLVKQREAELALKKAGPRNSDVLSAQGQLQTALGTYENTVIRAPAAGVVTKAAIKPGEFSEALKPVIVVQDVSKLYVEANINESDITTVKEGQPVMFTIDAFGAGRFFKGTVAQVDLAPTIKDGIVNYVIKASLDEEEKEIKSGMNANLVITTQTKDGVLAIPGAAITKKGDTSLVKKILNTKTKEFKEVTITTGVKGDGNMIEVLSGLVAGDNIGLIEKTN